MSNTRTLDIATGTLPRPPLMPSATLLVMEPEVLGAILIVTGVIISALELLVPGLIILPFGLGAIIAGLTGVFGAPVVAQIIIFIIVSFALFLALRPLARRLNADTQHGIGSNRLIGAEGVVLEHIPAGDTGIVRIDREEWRAEPRHTNALTVGTRIRVTDVVGTRVIVEAIGATGASTTRGSNPLTHGEGPA